MDEKGDKLDQSLSEYLKEKHEISSDLHPYQETLAKLESLRDIPDRDPDVQAFTREAFLEQARSFSVPVSKTPNRRLKGWKLIFKK
jgi:hypothetical protein